MHLLFDYIQIHKKQKKCLVFLCPCKEIRNNVCSLLITGFFINPYINYHVHFRIEKKLLIPKQILQQEA